MQAPAFGVAQLISLDVPADHGYTWEDYDVNSALHCSGAGSRCTMDMSRAEEAVAKEHEVERWK